ncbi:MAG TPA: hypothetical protein VK736_05610, partial [Candidatus Binatia bacterium]|nr:hypothetical protein [Candidatus Binatia bacterium]
ELIGLAIGNPSWNGYQQFGRCAPESLPQPIQRRAWEQLLPEVITYARAPADISQAMSPSEFGHCDPTFRGVRVRRSRMPTEFEPDLTNPTSGRLGDAGR